MGLELMKREVEAPEIERNSRVKRHAGNSSVVDPYKHFKRGQIISLHLKNFVTFDDVVLQASPQLNLIAAPNGTGKSTIASALCIVFCVNVKILERASSLQEFIKRGTERATVEVDLYEPKSPKSNFIRHVSRTFDKNRSDSCFIDGKPVRKAEVTELCKSLKIQLENLCLFLPQERISNFTSMEPKELFRRTLEATSGSELLDNFQTLLNKEEELKTQRNSQNAEKQQLVQLQQKRDEFGLEVNVVEEAKQLEKELEEMDAVRGWLTYEEDRVALLLLEEEKNNSKAKRNEQKSLLEGRKEELEQARRELEESTMELDTVYNKAKKLMNERSTLLERLRELRNSIKRNIDKHRNHRPDLEKRQREVQAMKERIAQIDEELRNSPSVEHLNRKVSEVKESIRSVDTVKEDFEDRLGRQKSAVRKHEEEINNLKSKEQHFLNFRLRQLDLLERQSRNIKHCVEFQGNVFGPIGLEIQVNEDYHARILEACIPISLRRMFVVESSADFDLLRDSVCFGIPIDCVCIADVPKDLLRPPFDLNRLNEFGLSNIVSNIFEAPQAVKLALCSYAPLSSICVGSEKSREYTEAILEKTNIRSWFTPWDGYRVNISRFSHEKVIQTDMLPTDSQMFSKKFQKEDLENIRSLINSKQTYLTNLQREQNHLEQEVAGKLQRIEELKREEQSLTASMQTIENIISERRRLEGQLKDKENELLSLNLEEQSSKVEEKIAKETEAFIQLLEDLQKCMKRSEDTEKVHDQKLLCFRGLEQKVHRLEVDVSELQESLEEAQRHYQNMRSEYNEKTKTLMNKMGELEASLPLEKSRQVLKKYPKELSEFDSLRNRKKARLNCINYSDSSIITEYENVCRQIELINNRLHQSSATLEEDQKNFDEDRYKFLEKIQTIVSRMNERFSDMFTYLDCRGQLTMSNTSDLKNLSIQINVSFRDSQPLLPLCGARNSGGEKMVSIMLYIFSMQTQTCAPFRLVDEMNQGMDPAFERKIVSLMVQDARDEQSPQTFLITPKLLSNLELGDETRVHFIFNGPCVNSRQGMWNRILCQFLSDKCSSSAGSEVHERVTDL